MIKITEKIYKIENLKLSNVYLLKEEDGMMLVDTGTPEDFDEIKRQLENAGISLSEIAKIIITHAHMDHVGTLSALSRETGADVYVHEDDYERIKDKVSQGKLHKVKDKDKLGGLEFIHIPGHTDGTAAVYHKESKVLLSGDCLFNNNGLSLPPEGFCVDFAQFKKNVVKLLDYDVEILCTGHGPHIDKSCNQRIHDVITGQA